MTALDVPDFGIFEGGRATSLRGRWTLIPGGTLETRPRRSPFALALALAPWRSRTVSMPLLSGALAVNEPVHLTVGEISVAVDKTRSVRLTVAEVTALGNRRFAVDVIASALGPDAGPDETIRLEGTAGRVRDGALRIALTGPAPASLISAATSPAYGPLMLGSLVHGSLMTVAAIPGAAPSDSLILSPTRGAGVRLKLIATFAR